MALQYLGVGLSKTGTTSLSAAMTALGIRTKHWEPDRLSAVIGGKNKVPRFDIYNDCECMTDIPHAYFYKEIGAAYPSLKYILTVRNEDKWFHSMCKHYAGLRHDFTARQMALAVTSLQVIYGVPSIEDMPACEFLLKKRYRDWNENVRRTIPSDRLLVMNICDGVDGWDSLCRFLNVDIPAIPFPNENKAKQPPSALRKIKTKGRRLLNMPKTAVERRKT